MENNQFLGKAEDKSSLNLLSSTMSSTNLSPNTFHADLVFELDRDSSIISEKLLSFYKKDELCDTVLIAGSKCVRIPAHRVVLCAFSEHFLEVFRGSQKLSKENVAELKEIEASTLKPIIDFMYNGFIDLNIETVEGILRTALFLKIKELVDGCCETISKCINSDNFLKFFRLANELELPRLKDQCLKGIFSHFEKISAKKKNLKLCEIDLYCTYDAEEEDIFDSMVNWIEFDKKSREHLVSELLSMIRFKELTPKFIVQNRKFICKTVEIYELTDKWLEWHYECPYDRSDDEAYRPTYLREKLDKLAVIGVTATNEIIIKTFNHGKNAWLTKLKIRLPNEKSDANIIVIDGKLIAVGGHNSKTFGSEKSVECLDLDTLEWTELPPMNKSKRSCRLANLNGNLCVSGEDDNNSYCFGEKSVSVQIYNFLTRKWQDLQPMCPQSRYSQITSHNGILYIVDLENGFLQSYDVSSNRWTSKALDKKGHLCDFGIAATEKFLYIYGGYYFVYDDLKCINRVERLNLLNNSCCNLAPLPFSRYYIKNLVLKNSIISCNSEQVDEYNLERDTWNTLGDLSAKDWSSCTLTYLN